MFTNGSNIIIQRINNSRDHKNGFNNTNSLVKKYDNL